MPSRSPARAWRSFNITPNHLSKLFAQHGTMRFIEYVRCTNGKSEDDFAKYHLSIHEVAQRCGFPDSDYFVVFRRQFGLTPESIAHVFRANFRRLIPFPAASEYFVHLARQTATGGSFIHQFTRQLREDFHMIHPFVSAQRQHDHQFDFAHF